VRSVLLGRSPLFGETNVHSLRTILIIDRELISDKVPDIWPLVPCIERGNVKENIRAATIGSDETETFVILPHFDLALIAHGKI